jgi:hypothetical protein
VAGGKARREEGGLGKFVGGMELEAAVGSSHSLRAAANEGIARRFGGGERRRGLISERESIVGDHATMRFPRHRKNLHGNPSNSAERRSQEASARVRRACVRA